MLPHNNNSVAIMRKPARRGVISRGSGSSGVGSLLAVVERSLRKKDHFFFNSSLTRTHVATTSYLTRPSETTGSVRDSSCCSAIRQRCCVANSNDVTVLDATPVVAIVKITSAHILYPFVVVVGRDTRGSTFDVLCMPPVVACLQTRGDQPRERRGENKARYDYHGNPNVGVGAERGQIQHRNYSRTENDRISH